jgi:hypothetical protein
MIDYIKKILTGQFEASLCVMKECLQKCPPEHWDGKIAKYAFWHVGYHTLCFVDLYLSPNHFHAVNCTSTTSGTYSITPVN